ncbi:MAG: MBOAT family protein [Bacteroidales bacterium]|nr:MBOAT family protein [Bacteroidales bacterium]MCF8456065.1 MBOAT family protein [Bacteroidales bacterium]
MLFNSIEFAIFLPIVFALYWFVTQRNLTLQNTLILGASYLFYGWWDWRFLSLIIFSSAVDYLVGLRLLTQNDQRKRKLLLFTSILVNIGFLGLFKYYNFFAESFADAFTLMGKPIEASRLNIVLPVGISFYTFQTLSYSIDVYKRKIQPTRDIIAFFAFVSFFPQLVAGPIERASHLLPQFYRKREFDPTKAVDGMRQILWGLFKKIVIADNCAVYVNDIFASSESYSGASLLLGTIFFAFQIYGDFSGYSDIAIGTARLFGIDLMRNFAFPYFSRDIAEFWRRWHISLSTWFRDYVYIPLGGSRGSTWMKIRNTFIIFVVSGFWHGANWTFLAWGFLNACYFLPLMLWKKNRVNTDTVAENRVLPNFRELGAMLFTFALTLIAWIFFRAATLQQAFQIIAEIFSPSLFSLPDLLFVKEVLLIAILIVAEWVQRNKQHALQFDTIRIPRMVRWGLYQVIIVAILFWGSGKQEFIYFQF